MSVYMICVPYRLEPQLWCQRRLSLHFSWRQQCSVSSTCLKRRSLTPYRPSGAATFLSSRYKAQLLLLMAHGRFNELVHIRPVSQLAKADMEARITAHPVTVHPALSAYQHQLRLGVQGSGYSLLKPSAMLQLVSNMSDA